jgi:hypothetical protein
VTQKEADVKITNVQYVLARDDSGQLVATIPGEGTLASFFESPTEIFPQRQATDRVSYSIYPPEDETVLSIEDFSPGFGRKFEKRDPGLAYYYATGIDCSQQGVVTLGPLVREATVSGISSILKFVSAGGSAIYALAVDSSGDGHLLRTTGDPASSTTPTWVDQAEFPGADDADQDLPGACIAAFRGTGDSVVRLYMGAESAHAYMHAVEPGTTITEHTGSEPAGGFAVGTDEFWRFEPGTSNISKTTNGGATPTWGSNIVVGEQGRDITGIVFGIDKTQSDSGKANRLYVLKTDGLYTVNQEGTDFDQYLTPFWKEHYHPKNGTSFGVHGDWLLFRFDEGVWAYSFGAGWMEQVGPEILPGNDVLRGVPTAFCSDGKYAYVAIKSNANNITYIYKGRFFFGSQGEITSAQWNPIVVVGAANEDVNDMFYSNAADGRNASVVFGRSDGTIGHFTVGESGLTYVSSGSIFMSRFQDLPGESKLFTAIDILAEDITATETVTAYFRANPSGGWQTVATWDDAGDSLGARKDWGSPTQARLAEVRLDLARGVDTSSTPKINAYELRFAYRVAPRWVSRMVLDLKASTGVRRGGSIQKSHSEAELRSEIRSLIQRGVLLYVDPDGNESTVYLRSRPRIYMGSRMKGHPPQYFAIVEVVDANLTATVGTWGRAGFFTWGEWGTGTWGDMATKGNP